ncbi:MAG: UPF0158 family protein [Bacteroidota bacterium]
MAKIKLESVIEQLEFASDMNKSFFNKITGEIHLIPEELERHAEQNIDDDFMAEWEKELIPIVKDINQNPDHYIPFPSQFDINEYEIMERFCLSLQDEKLREEMYSSIKGSGAFHRFKNNIHNYRIAEDWYKYKDEALKEIAIEWCKDNNIDYF